MKIKRGNRKRLTPKERTAMWSAQKGLCACGCGIGLSVEEGTVGEHSLIQGRNALAKHPAMKRLFSGKVVPRNGR